VTTEKHGACNATRRAFMQQCARLPTLVYELPLPIFQARVSSLHIFECRYYPPSYPPPSRCRGSEGSERGVTVVEKRV